MNVLIAPDAFKDSMTAQEVAAIMQQAVLEVYPNARCHFLAASDGGEGFLEAVTSFKTATRLVNTETVDPMGRPIRADYLFDPATATAYIELARASGIELLNQQERNPLHTTTYGTGLQIEHAIALGARQIYVGLGGSATNDGGTGMAHAAGFRFLDSNGNTLQIRGAILKDLAEITSVTLAHELQFFAINDVSNPLYGPEGAAHVYAKQKGADPAAIELLDQGLRHLDAKVTEDLGVEAAQIPGAGAAGGAGYGLKAFFDAKFISGAAFILELAGFRQKVTDWQIDLVLTGEGKIDHQTRFGKFVFGLAQESIKANIPVKAVCGKLDLDQAGVEALGLTQAAQLFDPTKEPQYSFTHAKELLFERTLSLLRSR